MKIGKRKIGDGEPCFVIAEAGINHNGDINMAKKLIDEASKIGIDCIKFQIFKTEELCSTKSGYFDTLKSVEFSKKQWQGLFSYASKRNVIFTASVFDEGSSDVLEEIGSPLFKIASGDITHSPLLRHVGQKNKPILLSTGASKTDEIKKALDEIYKTKNRQVALFHCVSNYPTDPKEANLKVIQALKKKFKIPVGFSDHTVGTLIPLTAVALGANMIEKHYTLDRKLPGPDHKQSLEPKEFKQMIEDIRTIENALGDGIKKPTSAEKKIRDLIRRSITSKTKISKGTIITADMIKISRPGNGIQPSFYNSVIGKKSAKDIEKDEIITWKKLC